MSPRRSRHSSSRRARARARTLLQAAVAASIIAAFLAAAFLAGDVPDSGHQTTVSADRRLPGDAGVDVREQRPSYRYSIVPGGVYDDAELDAAAAADPIVAAHYSHLSLRHVRVARTEHDRLVYMSYRKGDRVYWTRAPVRLPAGEVVLTDGRSSIRARCGNCISEAPMGPTSPEEPDAAEFDAFDPARPPAPSESIAAGPHDTERPIVSFPLVPPDAWVLASADDLAPATAGPMLPALALDAGQGAAPVMRGIAVPRATIPPLAGPDTRGDLGPWSEPMAPQPVPVPEPGTLLLLGGGLGAFALRQLRRSR